MDEQIDYRKTLLEPPSLLVTAMVTLVGIMSTAVLIYFGWNASIPVMFKGIDQVTFKVSIGLSMLMHAVRMGVNGLGIVPGAASTDRIVAAILTLKHDGQQKEKVEEVD